MPFNIIGRRLVTSATFRHTTHFSAAFMMTARMLPSHAHFSAAICFRALTFLASTEAAAIIPRFPRVGRATLLDIDDSKMRHRVKPRARRHRSLDDDDVTRRAVKRCATRRITPLRQLLLASRRLTSRRLHSLQEKVPAYRRAKDGDKLNDFSAQ